MVDHPKEPSLSFFAPPTLFCAAPSKKPRPEGKRMPLRPPLFFFDPKKMFLMRTKEGVFLYGLRPNSMSPPFPIVDTANTRNLVFTLRVLSKCFERTSVLARFGATNAKKSRWCRTAPADARFFPPLSVVFYRPRRPLREGDPSIAAHRKKSKSDHFATSWRRSKNGPSRRNEPAAAVGFLPSSSPHPSGRGQRAQEKSCRLENTTQKTTTGPATGRSLTDGGGSGMLAHDAHPAEIDVAKHQAGAAIVWATPRGRPLCLLATDLRVRIAEPRHDVGTKSL